jgi:hypothetical protein
MSVRHPVVHTISCSTALIGVVKCEHLGLKGRSIPHMKLPLFYKKKKKKREATPDYTLGACNPILLFSTSMKQTWKLEKSLTF